MRTITGVLVVSAFALTGCGASPLESAYETCSAEHEERQDAGDDAAGGNVISLEDDGSTVLINGAGNFLPSALRTFDCMAEETGAPASLKQKVEQTSGVDGRQSDDYDDVELSWSYSATDDGSFDAIFEIN